MHKRIIRTALLISACSSTVFLSFLSGCNMKESDVSSDINELRSKIVIDAPRTKVKWEIFGTPEYTGGVPGPTDFVTLIAEFDNVPPSWTNSQTTPINKAWVVPESPRSWLSPGFKALLDSADGTIVDLTSGTSCYGYSGNIRKSGRPIQGFACYNEGKALVYLTLQEPGS